MRFLRLILLSSLISSGNLAYSQVATPDFATTGENEPISFNITGNDIPLVGDIDPQTVDLDISLGGTQTSTSTTDGNYSIDASGELTFVPNTGYNGITTLQYTVEDEGGNVVLLPGLITITVTPNNPPSANNDNTSTNEEVAVSITVVTNDSDPEGGLDPATVDLNTSSVGIQNTNTTGAGSWSVNNAGTVLFTPVTDYSGNAQLSYTVNDDIGQTSNTATITITVNNINDTPVANDDAATTSEETPVNVNVLTNDTDPDGNGTINVATVDLDITAGGIQTTNTTDDGVWSVASGVVTFTPESDFTGPTSLDYTVNDNAGATSNAATISITVSNSNDPPVAVDDATTTTEETLVTLNVVSNDTDPDGNGTINAATVDLNTTTGGIQNTASSNGSWSVNSSGVVSFTPALNFTGPATLDYTVNDNAGATSSVGTITINVTNTNDPPEAVDDATTTTEETLVTINVVTNDTDPDGNGTINAATVDLNTTTGGIQNTASSNGSWSVNSSGVVSFTPALNFTGPTSLDYTVNDNAGATSSVGTITINVSNTNDPPVAVNDATTTLEDNPVNITVVSNDTDIDGTINIASVDLNTSTGGIQNSASNDDGVFSVNSMGVVTFTPDQDFNGQTTLNYTVNDNSGATSNIATITINVTANNDSPFAVADATTTPEETTVTLNVVANDTDPDGNGTINAATVDLNTSTGGIQNTASNGAGSWSVDASGVVTFTPANNFTGSGSLTYTVNDNGGLTSNQATISITVTPINDPPEAVNDAASGTEDNPVSLNVVTNDTDEEGTVRANSVDLNTGTPGIQNSIVVSGVGTFTVNGSGLVTFTPVLNFNGPASITYTVEDNAGATSNAATITITLSPVNDIPDAVDDVTTTSEETAVTINVLTNDSDADDGINTASVDLNTSTAGIQTTNTTGAGTWSVSGGIVTFTPASNYSGPASLNYTISDMSGATATPASISVTVTPTNDPPTAVNDAASTNEGNAITVNVVSNDTDPEGNGTINAATVDLNTATEGIQNSITTDDGSWTVNSSGVVTFTPVSEFNGPTSITYTVNDNSGATSGTATITITVNPVNDPPVAVADAATTNEETSVTIDVTDNDSDIDGTINVATVDLNTSSGGIQNSITIASVGTFSVNTAGIVTFTPVANFNGTATVNYTVNDNSGATSNQVAISVTVNATNDPPSAVNDAVTTNEDTPVTFNVVSNDTDVDGTVNAGTVDLDPSSPGIQNMASISGGNISVNTSGIITFTPSINFYGSTTASYTVNDNTGATSNTATISITVTAVNDPPIAVNDLTTADENEVVTWLVVSNDVDFDGSINVATVDLNPSVSGIQTTVTVTNVGTFTVDAAGLVTFTPVLNFNGVASINYTVRDNAGLASNAATLSISVNSINSDPVAANDAVTTNEEVAVTITILANDSDPDGSLIATTVDLNTATAGIQNSITVTGGTFTANTSGVVTFTPLANYSGPASTTYTVNDNVGATSNIATISVTVTSINDLPVAGNDAASTAEGTAVTFSVVANDTDIDGTINAATVDLNTTLSGIQNSNSTPAGSWTVSNLGFVTFTPVSTFSGPATLAYTVNDNSGGTSAAATITVTVSSVNDAPVAVNDAATTNEDVAVTLNVVTNDTDEDGNATINPATVDLNTATAGIQNTITTGDGTFTVNASGVVTFTPLADNNGPATTTYTVNDNGGLTSNAATITITVNSVNDLPQAQNDAATTLENTATTINVVSNDIDVEAPVNPTTVDLNVGTAGIQSSNTTPAGSWTVSAAGIVTFTPATGFNGTATLTYRVNDSDGATSNTATISVTVTAVNDLPVAANDAATTNEDVVITVNVVSNDVDDEGPVNAASVDLNTTITGIQNTISVTGGTFTVNASGIVTFTPALNYHGSAVASYTVNDGGGATSNVATITITVNSVNDAPVAANDAVTTNEDSPVTFNVVTNDSDAADDDGSINITTVDLNISTVGIQNTNSTAQGAFSVNAAGEVTFTPVANYAGTATLTYRVNDNLGLTSNTATITVTVQAINDPPVFTTIPNQRVLRNAAQKTITVTGISPGPLETEAMLLTATSGNVGLIPQPVVTYNGTAATATIAYQPAPNQTGTAIITVKLVDTGLNEYTQTFTIDVVDVQIISTPVTVAVEGELYEYFIEVTDVTETLTIAAVQKPSWATLTSLPSPPNPKNRAKLSGTPPAGAATNTEVRIQVKDGATVLNEQTFTLVVNHRPVVTSFHLDANEDEPLSFNAQDFQDVYTDQDGHPLTEIQFTQLPKHGVLRYANDNPVQITDRIAVGAISTIRYQTLPEYSGLDTLYWKASDGYSYSTVNPYIDFVISPVNDPPRVTFIEGDSLVYEVSSETPVLLTPLFNAEDVDDENLVGAELKFKEGTFTPNSDRLIFANTPAITGSFNPQTGILQLTGTAFVSDYVQAIRSVQYVYENFSSINLEGKAVLITLNDGKNSGLPAERLIRMIYTFKDLDIPSVFTANGDSRNDTWKIGVKDSSADDVEQFDKAEIRVYDKRGKLVFEAIGFAKQWDGTSLTGEPLPVDTYYYTIDLKYNKKSYKGAVTILR